MFSKEEWLEINLAREEEKKLIERLKYEKRTTEVCRMIGRSMRQYKEENNIVSGSGSTSDSLMKKIKTKPLKPDRDIDDINVPIKARKKEPAKGDGTTIDLVTIIGNLSGEDPFKLIAEAKVVLVALSNVPATEEELVMADGFIYDLLDQQDTYIERNRRRWGAGLSDEKFEKSFTNTKNLLNAIGTLYARSKFYLAQNKLVNERGSKRGYVGAMYESYTGVFNIVNLYTVCRSYEATLAVYNRATNSKQGDYLGEDIYEFIFKMADDVGAIRHT